MITLTNIQVALYDIRKQDAIAHRPREWRIRINPEALRQALLHDGILTADDILAQDPDVTMMGAHVDLDDQLPSNEFQLSAPFNDAGLEKFEERKR